MKKDSMLYVVLFTFIVCAAFTIILAVANEGTKDLVAANKAFAVQSAVLGAFGIPFANEADAASKYASSVTEHGDGAQKTWRAAIDGAEYIALQQSGAGLWGTISLIVAASSDAGRLRGLRVVAQNETPGLGGRIEEPWFLEQYEGERAPGGRIGMKAGAEASGKADPDKENGRVDGISGATRTSQAFESIVNAALLRFKSAGGGK